MKIDEVYLKKMKKKTNPLIKGGKMYNVQSLSLQEKIRKKAVKRDDVHEKIV